MNSESIAKGAPRLSPRRAARAAGAFFLLTLILGVFAQGYITESIVVATDASRTATNLLQYPGWHRLAFALFMLEFTFQIMMITLFYGLLRPVGPSGSLIAAALGYTGVGVKIISRLFFIAPLFLLGSSQYLDAFNAEQLQALAMSSLKLQYLAESIAVIFLGLHTIVNGYLLTKSNFFPRALGLLNIAAGLGWTLYLYEPLAARLSLIIVGVALAAAVGTIFWLLIFGVDQEKWTECAAQTDPR